MYYYKFADPTTFKEKLASFDAKSYEEAETKITKFVRSLYTAKDLGVNVEDIVNATT